MDTIVKGYIIVHNNGLATDKFKVETLPKLEAPNLEAETFLDKEIKAFKEKHPQASFDATEKELKGKAALSVKKAMIKEFYSPTKSKMYASPRIAGITIEKSVQEFKEKYPEIKAEYVDSMAKSLRQAMTFNTFKIHSMAERNMENIYVASGERRKRLFDELVYYINQNVSGSKKEDIETTLKEIIQKHDAKTGLDSFRNWEIENVYKKVNNKKIDPENSIYMQEAVKFFKDKGYSYQEIEKILSDEVKTTLKGSFKDDWQANLQIDLLISKEIKMYQENNEPKLAAANAESKQGSNPESKK